MAALLGKRENFTVNLGTGQGQPVPFEFAPRRAGDVAQCYADASLAAQLLGWRATHTLADMCTDAWRWQQGNPNGYAPNNE